MNTEEQQARGLKSARPKGLSASMNEQARAVPWMAEERMCTYAQVQNGESPKKLMPTAEEQQRKLMPKAEEQRGPEASNMRGHERLSA